MAESPFAIPEISKSRAVEVHDTTGVTLDTIDPFEPAPSFGQGARLAQRERKARILAAVRALIARHGIRGVTVRAVAEISGLSVQTIYNLVGKRAQLVEAAVSEHILGTAHLATSLHAYPNVLLALADLMWMNAVHNPRYAREATLGSNDTQMDILDKVYSRNVRSLRRHLKREYGQQAGQRGTDLEALALNITLLVAAVAQRWARGGMELPEFRYRLASAYGLQLIGLVPADEAAQILAWLQRLEMARKGEGDRPFRPDRPV